MYLMVRAREAIPYVRTQAGTVRWEGRCLDRGGNRELNRGKKRHIERDGNYFGKNMELCKLLEDRLLSSVQDGENIQHRQNTIYILMKIMTAAQAWCNDARTFKFIMYKSLHIIKRAIHHYFTMVTSRLNPFKLCIHDVLVYNYRWTEKYISMVATAFLTFYIHIR